MINNKTSIVLPAGDYTAIDHSFLHKRHQVPSKGVYKVFLENRKGYYKIDKPIEELIADPVFSLELLLMKILFLSDGFTLVNNDTCNEIWKSNLYTYEELLNTNIVVEKFTLSSTGILSYISDEYITIISKNEYHAFLTKEELY